jgi:hypothetical protein
MPQVLVYFVYSSSAGALAPLDPGNKLPPDQTALNITNGAMMLQNNDWTFGLYEPGIDPQPQWKLDPQKSVPGILGFGASATVSFNFDGIVSLTPIGQTQMYVQFSGFPGFAPEVFSLNIDKQELPTPGVCDLYCTKSLITISSEADTIELPLQWSITGASSIKISFSDPSLLPYEKSYEGTKPNPPLIQDSVVYKFSGITVSTALVVTCEAFDENRNKLRPWQFTVQINFPPRVISYSATVLPDGSVTLDWQTAGATQVSIEFLSGDLLGPNSTGNTQKSAPMPLLYNPAYALVANNGAGGKSSAPVLLDQAVTYGNPDLFFSNYEEIMGMTVSADNSFLYAVDQDNTIAINITGNPPFQPPSFVATRPNQGIIVCNSPDGKFIFVGCIDPNTQNFMLAKVFPTENKISYFPNEYLFWQASFAVSIKQNYIVITGEQSGGAGITVLEITNDTSFNQHDVTIGTDHFLPVAAAISFDGKYIFIGDNGGRNIIPIARRGPGEYKVLPAIPGFYGTVVASPTGPYVYAGGSIVGESATSTIFSIKINGDDTFKVVPSFIAPTAILASITGNGGLVFGQDTTSAILVYQLAADQTAQLIQTIPVDTEFGVLAVSPNGNFLFAPTDQGMSVMQAMAGKAIIV